MKMTVSRRRLIATAVGATLALTVAGCADPGTESSSSTSNGPTTGFTVGVSYPTSNSPFWQAYVDFVQDGAGQLSIKANAVAANDDEQKQLNDVQNLISQGVKGLLITPVSTSIAPALLKLATNAKIPVVVTDRSPGYAPGSNSAADYTAFIGPNDQAAGQGILEALVKAGGTNVLALGGTDGTSVAQGRKAGLTAGLDASAGSKLVQYVAAGDSQEAGQAAAENLLQAHPKGTANAFWCFNDNLCLGAIKAATNAGRAGEFKFGGMDLSPEGIAAVEKGTYTVDFGGHWLQGGFGLVMLFDKINGHDPKVAENKINLFPVDKTNVAEFKDQFITNPPTYDFKEMSQSYNSSATGVFEITLK